jgi:hypothetical protein
MFLVPSTFSYHYRRSYLLHVNILLSFAITTTYHSSFAINILFLTITGGSFSMFGACRLPISSAIWNAVLVAFSAPPPLQAEAGPGEMLLFCMFIEIDWRVAQGTRRRGLGNEYVGFKIVI